MALSSSVSRDGYDYSSLDYKIAIGLWKIVKGDMAQKLNNEEAKYQRIRPDFMLSSRQIAFRIFEHFKLPEQERELLDINALINLELRNDNIKQFD